MRKLTIAIDGPSGAGKGTVARAIARELGYRHVDSGAMYRAVGWKALRDAIAFDDEQAPAAVADVAALLTERDRSDATRAASPLYAAPDAEIVDTTGKPVEQVVSEVLALVRQKI